MTSLCTAYWQVMLAQGITMGIGMELSFLPSAAILGDGADERWLGTILYAASGLLLATVLFALSRLLLYRQKLKGGWKA